MKSITMVGCGRMGSALANAFLNHGFHVTIVDTNSAAAERFLTRSAKFATDINETLSSDYIVFNLPNNFIVESIIDTIPESALKGLKIINTTTAVPVEVESIYQKVSDAGALYLDGKIECYPPEIGPASGLITYSGDEALFLEARETLAALSVTQLFLGTTVATASELTLLQLRVDMSH